MGLGKAAGVMRALGVLGAIAALLAAYLLFFDHDPRGRGSPAPSSRLVAALDPATVRRLTIDRAGEPPFALVRTGETWRIQPGDGAADRGAIEDLVNAINQAESQRTADVTPETAGLSPPHLRVSVDDGRRSAELSLGKTDATGRGVFIQRRPGDAVLVGPRRVLQLADRPAEAWRDRRLLPFSPDLVTHVGWRTTADQREHGWDRTGDRWRNAAGDRLAPERVGSVLRRIAALQSDAAGADGGAAGQGWIALRGPAGVAVQLTPGQVPAGTMDDLWRALAAADTADRRLLPAPPERVRRVSLEDGDRRLVLLRDGPGHSWRFGPPDDGAEVEQTAITDWLARLAATNVAAPAGTGRRLVIDDRTDDAVTVGRSDPAYALLAPDPLRFRSRKVLDFAHFDVRELKRTGAGVTFDVHSTDGETWINPHPGGPIDPAAIGRVVAVLGNLRADSFLAMVPPAPPDIVLDVAVQAPGAPIPVWHRLQLWGGCVARVDEKVIFRIARAACNELRLNPAPKR
jgi:hypothetical protein